MTEYKVKFQPIGKFLQKYADSKHKFVSKIMQPLTTAKIIWNVLYCAS